MRNKLIIIITLIAIIITVLLNKKIMPLRREITDLELVRVMGLDYIEEAEMSLVRNKLKATSGGNDKEGGQESNSQEVLTANGKTFMEITKKIQTYTNKTISGGHIGYFIIGEETAKKDMTEIISFLAGSDQLRTSSRVYIVKGASAKDFLNKVIKSEYTVANKIDNMERNENELGIIVDTDFKDLLKIIVSDKKVGLISTFKLIDVDTKKVKNGKENEEDSNTEKDFDFDGYAVFKENKVIHFLTTNQSRAYNIINNKLQTTTVTVKNSEGKDVSLLIVDSKTNIDFKFDGDKLKKVVIRVKLHSNFEDAQSKKTIFKEIDDIEGKQNEIIKEELEDVIKVSKDINVDFIEISKLLEFAHPYKYKRIEKDWEQIWKDVEVQVEVESKIERSYDFIQN